MIDLFEDDTAILNSNVFRKTLWDAQEAKAWKTVECGIAIMYSVFSDYCSH
jgi:hypothetical protein